VLTKRYTININNSTNSTDSISSVKLNNNTFHGLVETEINCYIKAKDKTRNRVPISNCYQPGLFMSQLSQLAGDHLYGRTEDYLRVGRNWFIKYNG